MPRALKRFSMVGALSSAARMPLPGATRAPAINPSSGTVMVSLLAVTPRDESACRLLVCLRGQVAGWISLPLSPGTTPSVCATPTISSAASAPQLIGLPPPSPAIPPLHPFHRPPPPRSDRARPAQLGAQDLGPPEGMILEGELVILDGHAVSVPNRAPPGKPRHAQEAPHRRVVIQLSEARLLRLRLEQGGARRVDVPRPEPGKKDPRRPFGDP